MVFDLREIGLVTRVALHGRLDTPRVDQIETRLLASVVPIGRHAILDLADVTFVSSTGIRMLFSVASALRLQKAKLVLFGAQPLVAESLTLAIAQVIPLVDDESQALALLDA